MNTESTQTPESLGSPLCCALVDALALVEFGPCRDAARPQDWMAVASPMCQHCEGTEDVNFAAARILAAEYKRLSAWIKDAAPVLESACCALLEENMSRIDEIPGCQAIMEMCPVEFVRMPHLISHNTKPMEG
jgi:hypothetical protein